MERRKLLRSAMIGGVSGISSRFLPLPRAEGAPLFMPDPPGEGWENIGGVFSCPWITPVAWGTDRIDLFGIAGGNGDANAWHKAWRGSQGWDPPNQGWATIGGSFKAQTVLSSTSWGRDVLDVFGIGYDGRVWHKAWRGGPDWDPPGMDWTPIGGDFTQALAITAISWGPNRIDLFGIAADNSAWHKAWRGNQGWNPPDHGWAAIGGSFKPGTLLSATTWGTEVLDVFGIGEDGRVWHKAWRGGADWDPPDMNWSPIGGNFSNSLGIAATSWGPSRIDLVGISGITGDASAWHKAWRGSQGWDPPDQGWASIGGNFAISQLPSLVSRSVDKMDITAIASESAWGKGWYGGPDWDPTGSGWAYLGGRFNPDTSLVAVSRHTNSIDVFGLARDGSVWHRPNVAEAVPPITVGDEIRLSLPAQETTCAAFPAHDGQPGLLIVSGSGGDWGGSLWSVPLDRADPVINLTGKLAAPPKDLYSSNSLFPDTDNQTIRVGGGAVINIKSGGTNRAITPKPGWWDQVKIHGKRTPGFRYAELIYQSTDRGRTWDREPISSVDPASVAFPLGKIGAGTGVEVGRSSWPQLETATGDRVPGGWDRPDAYFCPWTKRLYLHVNSHSGNNQDGHITEVSMLFVSEDGGRSWDVDQNGNLVPRHVFERLLFFVIAMTSRPNGNFYMYTTGGGGVPTLRLSVDGGRSFTPKPVYFEDQTGAKRLNEGSEDLRKVGLKTDLRQAWTHAISRTRSGVRIAYCSQIRSGASTKQLYNIVSVVWDDPLIEPSITSVTEIVGETASASVLYATFVETDRVELDKDNISDTALLYWVETAGANILVRGSVMHGHVGWTAPFRLSVRSWEPNNDFNDFAIGDYMKGAFYYDGSLNFLALWPEVTATSQECCYRIVSVVPDAT